MGIINVLDFATANLIAAGEVAERPASVVKELIENSVDAGASRITVEIRGGGIKLIRVTDDGSGMEKDDLSRCILRHATSKISSGKDLSAIGTLGFRGEALAATSAVSIMNITSKTREGDGHRMTVRYGSAAEPEVCGAPLGTTVSVSELFSNAPARLKFMKQDRTEASYVHSVCEMAALANPFVAFSFISDGVEKLSTSGDGNLKSAIYAVLGRQTAQNMTKVASAVGPVSVSGYIASPKDSRPNRSRQIFFVNGRHVKSGVLSSALEAALSNFTPKERFPVCVLNVQLHPSYVDVNVHPAKTEVKFASDKSVYDAVYFTVSSAAEAGLKRPELDLNFTKTRLSDSFLPVDSDIKRTQLTMDGESDVLPETAAARGIASAPARTALRSLSSNELFAEKEAPKSADAAPAPRAFSPEEMIKAPPRAEYPAPNKGGVPAAARYTAPEVPKEPRGVREDEKPSPPPQARCADYEIMFECWNTYLFVRRGDSVYVIDKHAAHERIIFESLKKNLKDKQPEAQLLMIPVDAGLSRSESELASEYENELLLLGFILKDGELTAYPSSLTEREAIDMFHSLLSELSDEASEAKHKSDAEFEKALYQSCCKGAVKGGEHNTKEEIALIVERVMNDPSIAYCPHGRPVMFEMTKGAIERRFGRA